MLEVERHAYCRNKMMSTRLRAWNAKEVQKRVHQKKIKIVVPFAFMGPTTHH